MSDQKIGPKRESPVTVADVPSPVRPKLAEARAKAQQRATELDAELQRLTTGGSWQTNPARRAEVGELQRERNFLAAKLWLDLKAAALENAAEAIINSSQKAMTQDARSRSWLGPVGKGLDGLQQVGASTLEGVVGAVAGAGRLAQIGELSAAEDALLHHPLQTLAMLGKGLWAHTKDVYQENGWGAALGDASTLGLAGLGEVRLVAKTLTFAKRVAAPLPGAIAAGVQSATGIAAQSALPAAKVAVNTVVGAYVAKEAIKLGGITAASEVIGNEVRHRTDQPEQAKAEADVKRRR